MAKSKQTQQSKAGELLVLQRRMRHATDRLAESIDDLWGRYVDRDEDCEPGWTTVTAGTNNIASRSGYQWGFASQDELFKAQAECRQLASRNEFAINGHENRVSYIVGTGHVYRAAAKKGRGATEEQVAHIQAIVDDFVRLNRWQKRQAEIVRRLDRDGEVFLRMFVNTGGDVRVRFVEPEQVYMPLAAATNAIGQSVASFGIETEPDDVETVTAFWIDGKAVEAQEIQHRKANVDCNVKRGMPLFYPVRKNLSRVEKLLRNMSTVAEIQSAIALVRRHINATQATIGEFVAASADAQRYNSRTGKTDSIRRYGPGTILDVSGGTEYDFPSAKVNSGAMVTVLQAELRAVASRLVMPEFMLTSDASNANYASTMVAEGPAVKMFERLQAEMIEDDSELLWLAVQAKVGEESEGLREVVEIQAMAPSVAVRDRVQETNRNKVLHDSGVLSPQTWSLLEGLDFDQEQTNQNEFKALQPSQVQHDRTPDTRSQGPSDGNGQPDATPTPPAGQ